LLVEFFQGVKVLDVAERVDSLWRSCSNMEQVIPAQQGNRAEIRQININVTVDARKRLFFKFNN
jgi:hypothetical protein